MLGYYECKQDPKKTKLTNEHAVKVETFCSEYDMTLNIIHFNNDLAMTDDESC